MPGGHEKVKTRRGWRALGEGGWDRVLLGKTVLSLGEKEKEMCEYIDISTSNTLYLHILNIENPQLPSKKRAVLETVEIMEHKAL